MSNNQPTMQIPGVDNLYLVSQDVGEARELASQMMARAALICVERILAKQ